MLTSGLSDIDILRKWLIYDGWRWQIFATEIIPTIWKQKILTTQQIFAKIRNLKMKVK